MRHGSISGCNSMSGNGRLTYIPRCAHPCACRSRSEAWHATLGSGRPIHSAHTRAADLDITTLAFADVHLRNVLVHSSSVCRDVSARTPVPAARACRRASWRGLCAHGRCASLAVSGEAGRARTTRKACAGGGDVAAF